MTQTIMTHPIEDAKQEKKQFIIFLLISALIIAVFSFALFGFTGARITFGIAFMSLPFYLILNNFELGNGEKIIFSILMGLTIFSGLVYLLGLLISFRVSIILVFIILLAVSFVINFSKASS